jgi:AcrR family transcriptional regulator
MMARTQAADYEQRREAIVSKAAALFAERGFRGASMSDLATACETSKSLLYHYYSSKEDLLHAVMLSHVDQLLEDVSKVMEGDRAPKAKLSALIHAFMSHYIGAADRQKVLLNELDNLPPSQRATIVGKQRAIIDDLQRLLADAFGDPGDPAQARVRTMLVFGMINWTHTWFDPSGPVSPTSLADMVIDIAEAGVRGSKDQPAPSR